MPIFGVPVRPGSSGAVHVWLLDLGCTVDQTFDALAAEVRRRFAQHQPTRQFLEVSHQHVQDQRRAADVERLLVSCRHPARVEDNVQSVGGDLIDECG